MRVNKNMERAAISCNELLSGGGIRLEKKNKMQVNKNMERAAISYNELLSGEGIRLIRYP
jgi:hypothetical protein